MEDREREGCLCRRELAASFGVWMTLAALSLSTRLPHLIGNEATRSRGNEQMEAADGCLQHARTQGRSSQSIYSRPLCNRSSSNINHKSWSNPQPSSQWVESWRPHTIKNARACVASLKRCTNCNALAVSKSMSAYPTFQCASAVNPPRLHDSASTASAVVSWTMSAA